MSTSLLKPLQHRSRTSETIYSRTTRKHPNGKYTNHEENKEKKKNNEPEIESTSTNEA